MNSRFTISDAAVKISGVLGFTNTQDLVERRVRRDAMTIVRDLSAAFRGVPDNQAEATHKQLVQKAMAALDQFCSTLTGDRRDVLACIVFLDMLWNAAAHPAVQEAAAATAMARYLAVRASTNPLSRELQSHVRQRQLSAFPAVRRAAIRMMAHENVNARDVRLLESVRPALGELRVSIADRILNLQRRLVEEHREQWLAEAVKYICTTDVRPAEEMKLANTLGKELLRAPTLPFEVAAEWVLPLLWQNLSTAGTGFVERFLAGYGDDMASCVARRWVADHPNGPDQRDCEILARVLRALMQRGSVVACDFLFGLLTDHRYTRMAETELRKATEKIQALPRERRGAEVCEAILANCQRLEARDDYLREIARQCRKRLEDPADVAAMVREALGGKRHASSLRQHREAALAELRTVALNFDQQFAKRSAIALAQYAEVADRQFPDQAMSLAYEVYLKAPVIELKRRALEAMVRACRRGAATPGDAIRDQLAADAGDPALKEELQFKILDAWRHLFPSSPYPKLDSEPPADSES